MTDLRDRIASAIARVTAAKAPDEVLAELAKTHVLTKRGGLTSDVRAAVERMVDGTDTGEDRNVVRRWLGR